MITGIEVNGKVYHIKESSTGFGCSDCALNTICKQERHLEGACESILRSEEVFTEE